ncbi:hypothetical protein [Planktothrix agardhii]|nr:hypothetical protein [Planktothrix agardhii]
MGNYELPITYYLLTITYLPITHYLIMSDLLDCKILISPLESI